MPQTFSMTKVTFHLVSYELNMSQCLSPVKNSSCAVLGCKHILRAPPPPTKKICSVLNIYVTFFLYFQKKLTDHLYREFVIWFGGRDRWLVLYCNFFSHLCLNVLDPLVDCVMIPLQCVVAQINFTLPTMDLASDTVAILNSFVSNSYYGMLREKSGTTVFWFIVKYI